VQLSTLHPDDSISLRYHFDVFITEWVHNVCSEYMKHPMVRLMEEKFLARNIQKYLEQNLYIDTLQTVRELYRRKVASECFGIMESGYVECPYDVLPVLKMHWQGSGECEIRASYLRPLARRMARTYRSMKQVASATLDKYLFKRKIHRKGSIALELVEGANPETKSDVYWLSSGLIDPDEVILIFEPENSFFWDIDKQVEQAHSSGISNLVTLDPSMQRSGAIRYWYPEKLPGWAIQFKRSISRQKPGRHEEWLFSRLKNLVTRVAYWEEFFKENGVVAYQHFSELSRDAMPRQIAINLVGGIEFGRQRSQYLWPAAAANHFLHEVAFCWQHSLEEVLKSGYGLPNVYVESGYPYADAIHKEEEEAENMKEQLRKVNVKVIITALDNSPNGVNHLSWDHLYEFYSVIKEILESREDVGFIIKSKKPLISTNSCLSPLFKIFSDHSRCIVKSEMLSSIIPSVLAGDIIVGMPLSTALVEASLTGRPVVTFDPTNTPINPFKEAGLNPVFSTADVFKEYLLNQISSKAGSAGEGPSGLLVEKLTSDRKGGKRVANFVANFIDSRRSGKNKEAAMEIAINSLGKLVYVSKLSDATSE